MTASKNDECNAGYCPIALQSAFLGYVRLIPGYHRAATVICIIPARLRHSGGC